MGLRRSRKHTHTALGRPYLEPTAQVALSDGNVLLTHEVRFSMFPKVTNTTRRRHVESQQLKRLCPAKLS
jgi:hypothetical protein